MHGAVSISQRMVCLAGKEGPGDLLPWLYSAGEGMQAFLRALTHCEHLVT